MNSRRAACHLAACLLFVTPPVPAAVADGVVRELPPPVRAALSRFGLDGSGLSVYIADVNSGDPVFAWRQDVARNPASTMKLVTGLAALEILEPSYRWSTHVAAAAEPLNGTLDGDLFFVGGGDPYLVEERLWLLVRELRQAGLETIAGDIVIDDSLFAPINEDSGAFDAQPFRIYNVAPSAVLTNFNAIRFRFAPDRRDGRVSIQAYPALPTLNIDNRLRLAERRCGGYRRGISMLVDDGTVRFEGRFPSRCRRYGFTRSVLPAVDYTGGLFASLWRQSGGSFDGAIVRGRAPDDAVELLEFPSEPLGKAVWLMNKHSSNLIARHLLLTIGAERLGGPATEEKGVMAVTGWLREAGLAFPELVIENGAGRSRVARISAEHLVALIRYGFSSHYMPEFLASMAILGEDGTLDDRHENSRHRSQAHFKTGRLDHVQALAGIYQDREGRRYAVAILHNALDVHRGGAEAVQDTLLEWLGSQNDPG
ncbi:MAG: D-alanyl-D-alanine carboxypeptidase/D-alanyl-D-alanine-endopeptidase [Pseudomonadota bacterium]